MKFEITATISTTRVITGTINVNKSDVVDAGFCRASEDGDSTAWYGYVSEFLESEFTSSEYDYHASDIEDWAEYKVLDERVSDIDIHW